LLPLAGAITKALSPTVAVAVAIVVAATATAAVLAAAIVLELQGQRMAFVVPLGV
jgi:hypothetical protein